MKKLLLPLLALAAVVCQAADYHAYRTTVTEPSYSLAKIKRLIKTIKSDDEGTTALPAAKFNALSTKEKFTYCMLNEEYFSQNCNPMPTIANEQKKIFAYPPEGYEQRAWSEQQTKFLHNHRSEVIGFIRATIKQKHRVGANLKQAIVELDAYELIPDLVTVYNRDHKDNDIITVLMLLMKDGKYKPFLASSTYKKLYGDDSNYQAYDVANRANANLMIKRATAYYRQRTR